MRVSKKSTSDNCPQIYIYLITMANIMDSDFKFLYRIIFFKNHPV